MRREEELVDFEFKSHEQYIRLLRQLSKLTRYVQIVQIDGYVKNDPHIAAAQAMMEPLKAEKTNRWLGTITRGDRGMRYLFKKTGKAFFTYLMQYDSFFFNGEGKNGCWQPQWTDFGLDDIAFLDKDKAPLFFTTTHEGYAYVHPDVLRVDLSYPET